MWTRKQTAGPSSILSSVSTRTNVLAYEMHETEVLNNCTILMTGLATDSESRDISNKEVNR